MKLDVENIVPDSTSSAVAAKPNPELSPAQPCREIAVTSCVPVPISADLSSS